MAERKSDMSYVGDCDLLVGMIAWMKDGAKLNIKKIRVVFLQRFEK